MIGITPGILLDLTSRADAVVDQVLLHGSHVMTAPPRSEVGFVAAITLGAVPGIASEWQKPLSKIGYSLKVHGVFCHAAPVVDFKGPTGSPPGCELADLLVVTDEVGSTGTVQRRRASLIQAKMASQAKRVTLTGSSSKKQLHLYQNWPSFRFRESVYGTDSYSLKRIANEDAGTFGVIDRHFKKSLGKSPEWTQHNPRPTPHRITTQPSFGGFLAGMIAGGSKSLGRVAYPGGTDDWSRVVDLLLRVTYNKAFTHSSTLGSLASPRGTTAMAYLTTPEMKRGRIGRKVDHDWRPPFDGFETIEDDSSGGISVLRLEVSRGEEPIK